MSKQQSTNALASLLDEKMTNFRYSFLEGSRQLFADCNGKLAHPGEFGQYRESITKDFLSTFVPERMGVDSGFIVSSSGAISTQCDLVIYDKSVTPLMRTANLQRFFPIESVCAVGEVKSVLSLLDAKQALRKLASIKSMRDSLREPTYIHSRKEEGLHGKYQPELDERDQIFTFLICESFSFDIKSKFSEVLSCYNDSLPNHPFCHRHNMMLSIKNGLVAYLHPDGYLLQFPSRLTEVANFGDTENLQSIDLVAKRLKNRLVMPRGDASLEHIRHFCTLFHQGINIISVLFPDMGNYIQANEDVDFIDIEQAY